MKNEYNKRINQKKGMRKEWVASQLNVSKAWFYTVINSNEKLVKLKSDKLKVEKLCQIFNCSPKDIDFDNV